MEYISLLNLKNKYPSTNNYIKEAAGNVKLEGLYISDPKYYELYIKNDGKVDSAEYKVNFIKFDKPIVKLDEVVTVPKTSFNFSNLSSFLNFSIIFDKFLLYLFSK